MTTPNRVEVTPCPGGPLLVRGADVITDHEGREHEVTRPVVAVCVCEKSQRRPWCDGTHKVARDRPTQPTRLRSAGSTSEA